jgi:hypothetical protein
MFSDNNWFYSSIWSQMLFIRLLKFIVLTQLLKCEILSAKKLLIDSN